MSMSDEQFEKAVSMSEWCDDLRARDTAQREALARVEAEREERRQWAGHYAHQRDIAQAQLAEAVELIRETLDEMFFEDYPKLEDFLSRIHRAQAEQQEVCWQCGGIGEVDTGGVMPWGAPAMAKCPCQREDQAEQQEAQGAQAGDDRAAFEAAAQTFLSGLVQLDFSRFADDSGYTSSIVEWGFRVWQKRAALATQTAV